MPANAVVETTSNVDRSAARWLPCINGESGPFWQMQKLVLTAGDQPSYAQVLVPLKDLDDNAPAIAAIGGSPVEGFKIGAPASIEMVTGSGDGALVFTGVIVDVDEAFSADRDLAQVILADYRWLLEGFVIHGTFWMSGTDDTGYEYREAFHAHVNPGSAPNCIWRDVGGEKIPMFCNPWYGLGVGDQAMQDDDESTSAACYWTWRSWAKYLRFISSATAKAKAAFSFYHSIDDLHVTLTWPEGFATIMDEEDTGYDRKMPDKNFNGWQISKALSLAARSSGPYDLYFEAQQDENIVKIIRNVMGGGLEGEALTRPTTGKAQDVMDEESLVLEGTIRRGGRDLFTRFTVSGGLIFIERRVATNDANTGDLRKAWDGSGGNDDEETVRKYIEDTYASNGGDLPLAVKAANRKFDSFGHAYHLDWDLDFASGTRYNSDTRAKVGRPVLPHILTSYLQGDINATGVAAANAEDAKKFRRPVTFETAAAGSSTWEPANYNSGLKIDADGTLWVPGLREAGKTYKASVDSSGVVTLDVRNIRATLAIPHDRTLVDAAKISADPGNMDVVPGEFEEDVQFIEDGLIRGYFGNRSEFNFHERKNGWPIPETVTGATQATDKVLEDDTDELIAHVNKVGQKHGRVERAGKLRLSRYMPALQPGFAVSHLENSGGVVPVNGVIQLVTITSAPNGTQIWIDFGNVATQIELGEKQ